MCGVDKNNCGEYSHDDNIYLWKNIVKHVKNI